VAGGASAGSSRRYRLDPFALPVRHSAAIDIAGGAAFVLDRHHAVVKRPLLIGTALTLTVPITAYSGVAVRMSDPSGDGLVRVFVELLHRDPALTLPLVIADEPEDVAADWQAWGRALNLPLLVIGQDGSIHAPLARIGGVMVAGSKPRRRRSFHARRRPRFLMRRKTVRFDLGEQVVGREIIARD
jgi:hypothetical protein